MWSLGFSQALEFVEEPLGQTMSTTWPGFWIVDGWRDPRDPNQCGNRTQFFRDSEPQIHWSVLEAKTCPLDVFFFLNWFLTNSQPMFASDVHFVVVHWSWVNVHRQSFSFVPDYVVHGLFVLDFARTWRNKILTKNIDFHTIHVDFSWPYLGLNLSSLKISCSHGHSCAWAKTLPRFIFSCSSLCLSQTSLT